MRDATSNLKTSPENKDLPKNNIWREVWANWCIENFCDNPSTPEWVIYQNLWYNSNLKVNQKVIHYRKWEEKGIGWLNDLLITPTYLYDSLAMKNYAPFFTSSQTN